MGLSYTMFVRSHFNNWIVEGNRNNFVEFDPGSGRTLAVRLMHASRTIDSDLSEKRVADG